MKRSSPETTQLMPPRSPNSLDAISAKQLPAQNAEEVTAGDPFSQNDTPLEVGYFIPSSVVHYNIAHLRGETLRRMEIYVLRLLHRFNCALAGAPRSAPVLTAQLYRLRNELLVLQVLHQNIQHGIVSTQRDIFYHLVRFVRSQDVVNAVVQQLVDTLQVPRQALGVVAGARGSVGGTLTYRGIHLRARAAHSTAMGEEEESGSTEGAPIPSTEEEVRVHPWRQEGAAGEWLDGPFCILPETRFILVIEKHAVFYRLMAERLYQKVPCVLVTSHGFPTHTARLLVHNLHHAAPHVPVVGLVDYNPSGLAILLQYKWGGTGMRENAFTCVPALRWLGVRAAHLRLSPTDAKETTSHLCGGVRGATLPAGMPHKPFTPRDTALLANIAKRIKLKMEGERKAEPRAWHAAEEDLRTWLEETATMQRRNIKVELEALYSITELLKGADDKSASSSSSRSPSADFSMWVCQHLLRRDFI